MPRWILTFGVLCAVAAACVELLWLARTPARVGMAFTVRRLGLRVQLSEAQYEAFASIAFAISLASLVLVALATRSIVREALGRLPLWRWGLALAAILACVVPWHFAIGWADGQLCGLAYFGSAWNRNSFLKHLGLRSAPQLLWMAAILALGARWLTTPSRWPSEVLARFLANIQRTKRWMLVAVTCLLVAALSAAFSLLVLHGRPHYVDGFGYYFQAKTFAAGHVSSPLVGSREFFDPRSCPYGFDLGFIFLGQRWFFAGLPTAPLLYALGMLLGCPWLMGSLAAAGVVVASYLLAHESSGKSAAVLTLPMVAFSGWLILDSAEYLTHVPCMLAMLVFMASTLKAVRRGSHAWAASAGLALAMGINARPLTALALCLPFAVVWVAWLVRHPRIAWLPTGVFALALAVPMAGLLVYNAATTGSPLTFGYQLGWRDAVAIPAGEGVIPGWRWRPVVGAAGLMGLLYDFSSSMYRWPIPAAGVILAGVALMGCGDSAGRAPRLLLLSASCLWLSHFRWSEPMMETVSGPRYVSEALPLLAVLAAVTLRAAYQRLAGAGLQGHRVLATLFVLLLFCFGYGTVATVGGRLPAYGGPHGGSADVRMYRAVELQAKRPALVFVRVLPTARSTTMFTAAIAENDPTMRGAILYARDLLARNRELIRDLPGRHLYRWDPAGASLVPLGSDGVSEIAP